MSAAEAASETKGPHLHHDSPTAQSTATTTTKAATTLGCVEVLHDFVANSSIRGLKRTLFSPTRFLRTFWTVFLLGSFAFAASQVAFLLEKYLKRETTVQQQKVFGHMEEFPAVSFCVSDPFSDNAAALWTSGRVESPNNFSHRLRSAALRLVHQSDSGLAMALLKLDQREAYFQNVANQSLLQQLGHLQPFYFCAINPFDYGQSVFSNYNKDTCNLTVLRWLHPIYLNCYTLTFADPVFSKALKSIFLVLPAGRSEPRHGMGPHENASFLRDTLKKYTTLQVVLHEASKKPNFDETVMLSAHSSDVNVISFTTSKYVNNDCNSNTASHDAWSSSHSASSGGHANPNDFDACLEDSIENDVIRRCQCTQRLMRPNPNVPFCFAINWTDLPSTASRLACSLSGGTYLNSFSAASRSCPRPCQSIVYDLKLLRSANMATAWQRCWYMWMQMDSRVNPAEKQSYLMQHLKASGQSFNESACRYPWYHRLPYVKLKIVRQDFTTRTFNETLVLTSAALFAQVGAALAFYLGLTLTFLAEIVDLAVRLCTREGRRHQHRHRHHQHQRPTTSVKLKRLRQKQQKRKRQQQQQQQQHRPGSDLLLISNSRCAIASDDDGDNWKIDNTTCSSSAVAVAVGANNTGHHREEFLRGLGASCSFKFADSEDEGEEEINYDGDHNDDEGRELC